MNVTVRQLEAFVHVARLGSFTKAAQAMHVTQSALSMLVRELENALSTRLVNRTTRNVEVTAVGGEFLMRAERVLDDLGHAIKNVDQMVAHEKGRVVVAAPLVLSSTFLPPIIAGFKARFPGIDFVLRDSLPDQVLPNVKSGVADLGVGTFDLDDPDLDSALLFQESLVAVFPRDHALAAVKTLTWQHLQGEAILTQPRASVFRELAERGFAQAGLPFKPAFEASYVGSIIGLVGEGLGIAIVPAYASALADSRVADWKTIEKPVVRREVSMVHRARISLSPASQAFAEYLVQHRQRPA